MVWKNRFWGNNGFGKTILKKSVLENRFWKIDFGKTYFARFSHNRMRPQVIVHTTRSASRDKSYRADQRVQHREDHIVPYNITYY